MKRVLIIGAGFLQTFLIKKAKELNYYVITIDGAPNAEGFFYADEFQIIDITDKEKCLSFARTKNIDGVVTGATDYGVITTAYIAQSLELPGLNLQVAKTIKNKYEVAKILNKNSISKMKQLLYVDSLDNINELQDNLVYPVVVKPVDGSGSRGVHVINSKDNLGEFVKDALISSKSKIAFIQDYIEGVEYGADVFVYKDKITVYGPIGKMMTEKPYCAELGHYFPTKLDNNKINNQLIDAIKILKINFGAVNVDYIVDKNQNITIIDIGARCGGNCISSHIVPLAFTDDYIGNIIRISVGEEPVIETNGRYNVLTRVLALKPGIVVSYEDSFKKDKYNSNVIYEDHIQKGNVIRTYQNNLDGMGYVILFSNESMDTLKNDSEIIMKKINNCIRRK